MGGSNHYSKHQSNPNRCSSQCPLHRGCPLVGGSIIRGSTVYRIDRHSSTTKLSNHLKVCIIMLLQDASSLDCGRNWIDYGSQFPHLFKALVEILSHFNSTNLTSRSFSEAVCMLNNIVLPDLNTTVSDCHVY